MKVLVIGSGGREHALCYSILKSPLLTKLYALPGSDAISSIATCINHIKTNDNSSIVGYVKQEKIDLVIIGPEIPLINGLADELIQIGVRVFGPDKKAAQLEGSKIFMKEVCTKFNIPTAKYRAFYEQQSALDYISSLNEYPIVIKADGIAAGKGVVIVDNEKDTIAQIIEFFAGKFGEASKKIVIEEFLEGREVSFFAICDGNTTLPLGTAGDHKKIGDSDTGLNTGGMGTYAPSPFVDQDMENEVMRDIIFPTVEGLKKMGIDYKGVLFAGLMLTKHGPKLLEYNVRFGDPETQSLLLLLKTDLLEIMLKTSECKLHEIKLETNDKKVVTVVVAAKGYPLEYKVGTIIKGLERLNDVIVFHSGTKIQDGIVSANGGRVLCISAIANTFKEAQNKCYNAISLINWPDGYYRKDIASCVV